MSLIRAELERLARALDELDAALAERDRLHAAELLAARQAARAGTLAMIEQVDRAIDRIETVLSR